MSRIIGHRGGSGTSSDQMRPGSGTSSFGTPLSQIPSLFVPLSSLGLGSHAMSASGNIRIRNPAGPNPPGQPQFRSQSVHQSAITNNYPVTTGGTHVSNVPSSSSSSASTTQSFQQPNAATIRVLAQAQQNMQMGASSHPHHSQYQPYQPGRGSSSGAPTNSTGTTTSSTVYHYQNPVVQQQQQQPPPVSPSTTSAANPPAVHPHFRSKRVCTLTCKHCVRPVCKRGMKAILLADTSVELYSTDTPPKGYVVCDETRSWGLVLIVCCFFCSVQLVNHDYMTENCKCKIRDVACLTWYADHGHDADVV